MSLINQMLKDIDKRSSKGETPMDAVLFGTVPVASARRRRIGLWAIFVLALLVAAGFAWRVGSRDAQQVSAAVAGEDPGSEVPVSEAAPAVAEDVASGIEAESPASLDKLRLVQNEQRLQVEAHFTRTPAYRLFRSEEGTKLVLEFPSEVLAAAALPDTAGLPLLRSMAREAGRQGARLIFTFHQACQYYDLALEPASAGGGQILRFVVQPERVAAIVADAVPVAATDAEAVLPSPEETPADRAETSTAKASESEPPEMIRQALPPTPYERASGYYRKGAAALQQGRFTEAESALRTALGIEPQHIEARDLLLRLFSQQGRHAERQALLVDAVRTVPRHLPYRLAYARQLIKTGALDEARGLLSNGIMPPVAEAQDLYAMLATVCQRLGRYDEAVHTYRQLLAVNSEYAAWWLGLGIALEGALSEDQARQAYEQALACGGLSSGVQDYIRQRLKVLRNQHAQRPGGDMNADKETT